MKLIKYSVLCAFFLISSGCLASDLNPHVLIKNNLPENATLQVIYQSCNAQGRCSDSYMTDPLPAGMAQQLFGSSKLDRINIQTAYGYISGLKTFSSYFDQGPNYPKGCEALNGQKITFSQGPHNGTDIVCQISDN